MKTPIKEILEDADEVVLRRIEQRVFSQLGQESRRFRRSKVLMAATLLVGLSIAVAMGIGQSDEGELASGALHLRDGGPLVAATSDNTAVRMEFRDGSHMELAPQTALVATRNDGEHVALALARGDVWLEITPGGPRAWSVDLGVLVVRVTGTRFRVQRDNQRVVVAVERGSVEITGDILPDGPRALRAGERFEYPLSGPQSPERASARQATGQVPLQAPVEPATVEQAPEAAASVQTRPRQVAAPGWQSLAEDGAHEAAFDRLGEEGFRREIQQASGADQLMRLSDVARLSNHPRDAIAPLRELIERFPDSPKAPLAAFTLARLYQERLARPGDAADLYRRVLAERTPAGLREATMARLVESLQAANRPVEARRAACAYVDAFADGPYTHVARSHCHPTE